MIFDQLIVYLISNVDKFLKKSILHVKQNGFGAFIDILVIYFLLLTTYVLWEYMCFHGQKIYTCPTNKNIDKDFIYNTEECPICLNEFTTTARIECGHAYCLRCLVTYFKSNSCKWKCVCPLCKGFVKDVTILNNYARNDLKENERNKLEKTLQQLLKKQQNQPLLFCLHLWQNKIMKFIIIIFTTSVLFSTYLVLSYHVLNEPIRIVTPLEIET